MEQLLPKIWVELRGSCTAALEDAEAFRAQVGFSAAAASAATLATGTGGGTSASSSPTSAISSRSVVPIARFIEGVLRELMAAAAALPPFASAFLAMAERILARMLAAFLHEVRALSVGCPSTRLPNALPGALPGGRATAAGGGGGGGGGAEAAGGGGASASASSSASDLVAFLVSLRTQERPLLVPPQLRPLGAGGGGGGGGRPLAPAHGFGADGDAAEVELQYFVMRERPVGHERLVFGQGGSDRAVHLAAMSESLDFVAEAVIRLTAKLAEGGGGGGGGGGTNSSSSSSSGPQGRGRGGGSSRTSQPPHAYSGAANVPDLLLPVVQSYKALAGHCVRLLRLEALLLVGSHLAPVAAASHLCEEGDSVEARVPQRTVTDVTLGSLQRCLDRAYGLTPGAKMAEVVGAVVGAVQAPAERLGDVLLEGLVAGKDALLEGLVAGRDTLVAGVKTFQVRLMHVFHFSRPDLTTEELAGEKALRAPFNLEYEDRQRPVEAIQALVPRLLGPLPPDLVDAMLPKPAVSGNRAEPLASHLFAAWLGGAPLPPLEAATSSSSSSSGAGAGAAAARGGSAATSSSSSSPSSFWMSGLIGLWNRVLGRKQPAGGAAAAAAAGEEEKEEEEEKKKKTKREEAEKPARPLMSTAEAWAMYEQRALQRGDAAVAENGSELERGWLPELLLQK
ncbi:hypothetical protein VOLCADRAFT_94555 [Volvox carteri f. nagariensis]|uniref:Exocyst complex component Sec8 n=1 Tax=Volvox carteri f. nagariensis TaxID=3068 RepID=D8U536_VOLCA|nr:uncharacterized protein VOLCADRAFT_94555 [Volvox carteri f. nagariensis]EFJ45078.1 hypothetical protein VOLCADRAFT_94555 [Volvox carteri f. nagariensis]|eukprot:XP_002953754.1 hypothetical protein VOLCADRAFT_94555 [Volvox carteri f. nagariensis]